MNTNKQVRGEGGLDTFSNEIEWDQYILYIGTYILKYLWLGSIYLGMWMCNSNTVL